MSGDEEDELDAIWAEHRAATALRLVTLRRVVAAVAAGTLDDEQRRSGLAEAHTIAGAASIFGFRDGARLARELERALRVTAEVRDGVRLVRIAAELTAALDRDRAGRPER